MCLIHALQILVDQTVFAVQTAQLRIVLVDHRCLKSHLVAVQNVTAILNVHQTALVAIKSVAILVRALVVPTLFVALGCIHPYALAHQIMLEIHSYAACQVSR